MPYDNRCMETLDALRNSSKGKLTYNPEGPWFIEDIHDNSDFILGLSPQPDWVYERLNHEKDASFRVIHGLSGSPCVSPSPSPSPGQEVKKEEQQLEEEEEEEEESKMEVQTADEEKPQDDPSAQTTLLSPHDTQVQGCICLFEEIHRGKAKEQLMQRQETQALVMEDIANQELEQMKRFDELKALKQRQELQRLRDLEEQSSQEALGRQEKIREKMREEYRTRAKMREAREAEVQRQREAELLRQRQMEGRERLRRLNSIQEEVLQLQLLIDPAVSQTGSDLPEYRIRGNQLCGLISEVIQASSQTQFPTPEDVSNSERALQDMRGMISSMQQEVSQALQLKKRKEEEELARQQQTVQQKAKEPVQPTPAPSSGQKVKVKKEGLQTKAEPTTLERYRQLQDLCTQCAQSFEDLNSSRDSQTKKLKMELQKAASIPVSQISSISGSKLREVFDKISMLLSGRLVQSGGKSISVTQHPQGLDFVCFKLAEKFVKQGEEEVASHHEAAFPIAIVASGISELYPKVGDLILAHLHKKCPYAVPFYPPMKDGMSFEDYQRVLGYRVEGSTAESQDSFMKRMSGMIRLYAAMIQLRWPYGNKQAPCSFGLNLGWCWLAQILDMEPLADVTATLLFDFLEVCGNALVNQYQGQFWKLILLIKEEYFKRIEAVTSTGQMGSLMRLKQFLEKCIGRREIPVPKGLMSSSFWRS
ncbi:nucleoporin GLE1 [Polypterus senegalus]|uniref:nucleoporin GLE1 n=1 Tax=Polypterus senegalus TaxID=55291 RepID=UPI001964764E|nr:nucleoporin GLE1 [Polypterus senegalus]